MKLKSKLILPALIITIFSACIIGLIGLYLINRSTPNKNWDTTKAEYLARRVILNPTQSDIVNLTNAGSAQAAVNLLLTPATKDEMQKYNDGLTQFSNEQSVYKNPNDYQTALYTYKLVHDPNKAQRKLFYLWENTFSVDAPEINKEITIDDVNNLNNLIYNQSLGNYLQMVEGVRTNYAMDQYLDLTRSKAKNPNENFARELMQLFLMGQYTPLDKQLQNPNYTDADVSSLAYILTGYKQTPEHQIVFDNTLHSTGNKVFLGGNFNDPTQAVNYILSKRRLELSEFVAEKLLKFYVSDNPTDSDIKIAANIVSNNNFEILPTLKQILAADSMYSPTYMSEERYKSPLDLVSSLYTSLYGNDYSIDPAYNLLADLDYKPYNPGSIFGRDGYNTNALFLSGTIVDRWIIDSNKIIFANVNNSQQKLLTNVLGSNSNIKTTTDLINLLTQKLYIGRALPNDVNTKLQNYLTTNNGNDFNLQFNDPYSKSKLLGLISLMVDQPEFIMQGGLTLPSAANSNNSNIKSDSKLILVRLNGGVDYQQIVANNLDPAYLDNRKELALNTTNSMQLGKGYVLNNAAASLYPLLNSKEAFLIDGVGLPTQQRAHDIASKQMETGLVMQTGIIAQLFSGSATINSLIAIGNHSPFMYRGAQSLDIGTTSLALDKSNPNMKLNTVQSDFNITTLNAIKDIITTRQYPGQIGLYYSQVILLDKLASDNIASGGTGTPGNKNSTQFPYIQSLITKGIGQVYYISADGKYDTHANEGKTLDTDIKTLIDNVTKFYNSVKSNSKITIVMYSEFGRTDKVNGSNGTDHGIGGGMIVLSNELKWPEMVGSITPSKDQNNWAPASIDARDIWTTIFNSIYQVPVTKLYGRSTTISSYPVTLY